MNAVVALAVAAVAGVGAGQTVTMERSVVVTGTSRGIGRATALRLARAGFEVFGTVRSADDATRLEHECDGSVRSVQINLADDSSIQEAIDLLASFGVEALHGLVNVAAADGRAVPLECVTRADLDKHFAVTATGTAILTASMIPLLRIRGGRVVNVGGGALPMPLFGAAFAAKQALETMSDVLRVELAEHGIRVSVVEPAMTRWEDVDAQLATYDEALDQGVDAVSEGDRVRYRRAADALKKLNRRMLERGAAAEDVAATIERALTTRRPRARYYCGVEQKFAAVLARVAPTFVTDRVLRTLARL
jgi:NAD(P)-dependent dehydrogenase (short-subunit alcohol dehydrogenase family)